MPDGPRTDRDSSTDLVNIPNVITFARLCAVPLAIWLTLQHRIDEVFFLFVAAGLSDAVDGWLARRRGTTSVGAVLDPVADKALLVSMYVTLAGVNILPDWLAILVVFRDVLIVGGVLLLAVLGQPARSGRSRFPRSTRRCKSSWWLWRCCSPASISPLPPCWSALFGPWR